MSQTMERPETVSRSETAESVDMWLSEFQNALSERDVDRAAGMFATSASGATSSPSPGTSSPSRAPPGRATCSTPRWTATDPTGFARTEEPTEADGVIEAWLEFETAVGRGQRPPAAHGTARPGRC